MPFTQKQPAILLVTLMGLPLLAQGQCPVTGPNLLVDADFTLEGDDPQSPHWKSHRHAGAAAYSTQISKGELTIRKTAPQHWFYFGQRVSAVDQRQQKLAFSAELKLDLTPASGEYRSFRPGGGLAIKALTVGGILWTSQLNHQPRIGKTDWQPVQVVFTVPANAQVLDLASCTRRTARWEFARSRCARWTRAKRRAPSPPTLCTRPTGPRSPLYARWPAITCAATCRARGSRARRRHRALAIGPDSLAAKARSDRVRSR